MSSFTISGVILSGGKSRRMEGIDKGLLPLTDGKSMIEHVLERLVPQVGEVLISANREPEHYAQFGYRVIPDIFDDFPGPLAGLHAALCHTTSEFVVSVSCDSPLLPHDLVARLRQGLITEQADIAVAAAQDQVHHVFCLVGKPLLSSLETYIRDGGHKVGDWQRQHRLAIVNFDDQPDAFMNINTPEELARLKPIY